MANVFAILFTSPPCDPAAAKRTQGKGAEGSREAASLAARPAQAVAPFPRPPLLSGPSILPAFLANGVEKFCERAARKRRRAAVREVQIR